MPRDADLVTSLSLGKDGLYTLSVWRSELNQAIEGAVRHYTAATADSNRRNTVYGCEMLTGAPSAALNMVDEREELLRPISPPLVEEPKTRPVSTGTFGQPPPTPDDVPANVNTARNSLATLITALDQELRIPPPSSAASDVTLFDFDTTTGPLAESTPHESKARSRPSSYQQAPPVPQLPAGTTSKSSRRSSIMYIKSDENSPPAPKHTTAAKTVSQWSSRAVKPLMPKTRSHKIAKDSIDVAQSSPRGLRPLSLLQDRDVNSPSTGTRALSIGKKQKHANDENADPSPKAKGLKPLRLVRKDTTKERAALRKTETLPNVVVRPPSEHQHNDFGYAFAQ